MKQWTNFQREDLRMIPRMEADGWETLFRQQDIDACQTTPDIPPRHTVNFKKGNLWVWPNKSGRCQPRGWVLAEIINRKALRYKEYNSLQGILGVRSEKQ